MKKYLLFIGCVCAAFAAFADDNVTGVMNWSLTPSVSYNAVNSVKDLGVEAEPKGGKPRKPVTPTKPTSGNLIDTGKGTIHPGSGVVLVSDGSASFNTIQDYNILDALKLHFIDNGKEPLGGKPRKPVDPSRPTGSGGIFDHLKANLGGAVTSPAPGGNNSVTIEDVTNLIDELLNGTQSSGKSIDDVTSLIDQMLKNKTD